MQLPDANASNELLRHLLNSGLHVQAFNEILPSLNEIFIRQVGEDSRTITNKVA